MEGLNAVVVVFETQSPRKRKILTLKQTINRDKKVYLSGFLDTGLWLAWPLSPSASASSSSLLLSERLTFQLGRGARVFSFLPAIV